MDAVMLSLLLYKNAKLLSDTCRSTCRSLPIHFIKGTIKGLEGNLEIAQWTVVGYTRKWDESDAQSGAWGCEMST